MKRILVALLFQTAIFSSFSAEAGDRDFADGSLTVRYKEEAKRLGIFEKDQKIQRVVMLPDGTCELQSFMGYSSERQNRLKELIAKLALSDREAQNRKGATYREELDVLKMLRNNAAQSLVTIEEAALRGQLG